MTLSHRNKDEAPANAILGTKAMTLEPHCTHHHQWTRCVIPWRDLVYPLSRFVRESHVSLRDVATLVTDLTCVEENLLPC